MIRLKRRLACVTLITCISTSSFFCITSATSSSRTLPEPGLAVCDVGLGRLSRCLSAFFFVPWYILDNEASFKAWIRCVDVVEYAVYQM